MTKSSAALEVEYQKNNENASLSSREGENKEGPTSDSRMHVVGSSSSPGEEERSEEDFDHEKERSRHLDNLNKLCLASFRLFSFLVWFYYHMLFLYFKFPCFGLFECDKIAAEQKLLDDSCE